MTETIVDLFKIVNVKKKKAKGIVAHVLDPLAEDIFKAGSVVNTRKPVCNGHELKEFFRGKLPAPGIFSAEKENGACREEYAEVDPAKA